jgi:hypothetical protein
VLRTRNAHPADDRQVHREALSRADARDGVAVAAAVRLFGHSSTPRHGVFGVWTLDVPTVAGVSASVVRFGSDPLTDFVTEVLAVPLRELYAVLWRAGVVEIDD